MRLAFFAVFLVFSGCSGVSEDALKHLPGYWEIKKVTFPDGADKTYTANTTVDYFELSGKKGFRKKMQPTLKGTFNTSDDALPMQVVVREGRLFISFSGGGGDRWEEEVLELTANRLVTQHENGLTYTYTRYEPINLTTDGPK